MHRRTLPLLLAATLLFAPPAWADPKDDARRHFASGLQAAQDQDYEIALQHFLAAQSSFPHPATLFNIAKAYNDLDEPTNALQYYRLYQDAAPDKADTVAEVVAALESRLGRPGQPVAPVAGAPGQVVVVGPSPAELDRLSAIAEELADLRRAFEVRAEAAEDGKPVASEGEFLSDAYERQVITASRVGQDPLDSPSTLSVVTGEDLLLSGAISLADALRRVPGIDVMSLASGQQDVSIRGFNRELNNKVLILIDGRTTYLDLLGTTLWAALPISLEDIDRIEVIRGPGSAVYGANALNGVINIITHAPGEARTVARVIGGSSAYGRGSVSTSGRKGKTAYRLSGGYQQLGRWAKTVDATDPNGDVVPGLSVQSPLGDPNDLGLRVVRGSARIDRPLGEKGFMSVQAGIAEVDTLDYVNIGALGEYAGDDQRHHFTRLDLGYDVLQFRAFWNHDQGVTGPYLQRIGSRDLQTRYRADAVDLELSAPIPFSTGAVSHVLNLGLGYRRQDTRLGYLAGGFAELYTQNHLRGFINEQLTIGRFGAVASIRLDKHPLLEITQTASPRAALIYRLFEDTSVRATAGTAFRQPTSIESYMDLKLPTSADGAYVRDLGNTNLAPERITTFELGVHDQSSLAHAADLVVFYNRVTDLIFLSDVVATPGAITPDGYQAGTTGWVNLGEVYTSVGLEADLELYPVDGLDLFANLALNNVTEKAPDGTQVRDGSTSVAKINLGATYRSPYRVDLSGTLHHVTAQTWRLREFDPNGALVLNEVGIPARTLLSMRIAVRPLPDEQLSFAVGIWNALGSGPIDQRTREHPKGQPIRDVAFGEVSYAF